MRREKRLFDEFAARCAGTAGREALRCGLIGEAAIADGPFGGKRLVYADYVASGRALRQIEEFILEYVLPYYANSHTETSFCGQYVTRLRSEARSRIAEILCADETYSVVFTGSGATAGINRIVRLLGVAEDAQRSARPVVLLGPYEHHSNILPWRESGAEVIEVPEHVDGGPDGLVLEDMLRGIDPTRLRIGAFSAASNVTGIVTDVQAVNSLLKRHGVVTVWDYAGAGPYLPIDMRLGGGIDAAVLSPHKFPGGPAASGVMAVRKAAIRSCKPTWPGGGTVSFVSPWAHDYADDLAAREEAGTPNVIGDIRAALALIVKDCIGQDFIDERQNHFNRMALERWDRHPQLELLGAHKQPRLPIFSFRVRGKHDGYVHHQLVTRLLSDVHGIQARGGCACAGPYAHRLLGIDQEQSEAIRSAIARGEEMEKPGWTRLSFSYLLTEEKARFIIDGVEDIAWRAEALTERYAADPVLARFSAVCRFTAEV